MTEHSGHFYHPALYESWSFNLNKSVGRIKKIEAIATKKQSGFRNQDKSCAVATKSEKANLQPLLSKIKKDSFKLTHDLMGCLSNFYSAVLSDHKGLMKPTEMIFLINYADSLLCKQGWQLKPFMDPISIK